MTERRVMVENAYTQHNYLIQLCTGCTYRLNGLEAKYHKMRARNWYHTVKQLKAANHTLHDRADALQNIINWYRARYRELKDENKCLRSKLARYAELEKGAERGEG